MSLKIQNLNLSTWRNFKELSLEFAPGLTILLGPNAVGKTNTVEALQYITTGISFRKPTPSELILEGYNSAAAYAQLIGDGRSLDVEVKVSENKRHFFFNKKAVKPSTFATTLPSVLFNPDDLLLIKSSASHRRDEFDFFGSQINASYKKVYSTYIHSIEQRNHLLKDGVTGVLLDSWDESVALGAATLLQYRLSLFKNLKSSIEQIYTNIVSSEQLTCTYIPSILKEDVPLDIHSYQELLEMDKRELTSYIQQAFLINRDIDIRRGQTTIGPHRDDICFKINNKDARKFGSQGQQRSCVLAWKIAEVELCEKLLSTRPVLLLDDVMSELDEQRRGCITNLISQDIQTIITTTNLGYFNDKELKNAKVVEYE